MINFHEKEKKENYILPSDETWLAFNNAHWQNEFYQSTESSPSSKADKEESSVYLSFMAWTDFDPDLPASWRGSYRDGEHACRW